MTAALSTKGLTQDELMTAQMLQKSSDSDLDAFTGQTFKELHDESIDKRLPAYVIALVQFNDKTYKKYDASRFTHWFTTILSKSKPQAEQILTYTINRKIEKVIFAWQACFQITATRELLPKNFNSSEFLPLPDYQLPSGIPFQLVFIEACNNTVIETSEKVEYLSTQQFFIADELSKNKSPKHSNLSSQAGIWVSLAIERQLKLGVQDIKIKITASPVKLKTPPTTPERSNKQSPTRSLKQVVAEATRPSPVQAIQNRVLFADSDSEDDLDFSPLPSNTIPVVNKDSKDSKNLSKSNK